MYSRVCVCVCMWVESYFSFVNIITRQDYVYKMKILSASEQKSVPLLTFEYCREKKSFELIMFDIIDIYFILGSKT